MASHSSFIQAYHLSSGYLSSPGSTLNFVFTVSATPQQKRDFSSQYGCLTLSARLMTSNQCLLGSSGHSPTAKSSVESTRGTDATNPAARPRRRIVTLFSLFLWNKAPATALRGQANRWRPKPQRRIGSMVTLPLPAVPAIHGRLFFFIGNEGGRLCV